MSLANFNNVDSLKIKGGMLGSGNLYKGSSYYAIMDDFNPNSTDGLDLDYIKKNHIRDYHPYVYETMQVKYLAELVESILNDQTIINITDQKTIMLYQAVLSKLKYYRFKYPVVWAKNNSNKYNPVSPEETADVNEAVLNAKDYLLVLRKLWDERVSKYDDYMNVTYTGSSTGNLKGHEDSSYETKLNSIDDGTSKNVGHSDTENTGSSSSINDSQGSSDGKTHDESSGSTDVNGTNVLEGKGTSDLTNTAGSKTNTSNSSDTKGDHDNTVNTHVTGNTKTVNGGSSSVDGTVRGISVNANYPEANNLSGMYVGGTGVEPGHLGLDYMSDSNENTNKTDSTTKNDNTSTVTPDVTTDTEDKGENSSHTEGKGETDVGSSYENKGTTTTDNTTTIKSNTKTQGNDDGTSHMDTKSHSDTEGKTKSSSITDSTSDTTTHNELNNDTTNKAARDNTQDTKNDNSGRSKDLIALSNSFQEMIKARSKYIHELVKVLKPCFMNYVGSFTEYYLFNDDIYDNESDTFESDLGDD